MKLLVLLISVFLLSGCGSNEREIDYTDSDTFIEELAEHFEIEEEPNVLTTNSNMVSYLVGDFWIDLDNDRNLFKMNFTSDKEGVEDFMDFLGISLPRDFDDLEPDESTEAIGNYAFATIIRRSEEETQRLREAAEEEGKYFDAREDYKVHLYFFEEDE